MWATKSFYAIFLTVVCDRINNIEAIVFYISKQHNFQNVSHNSYKNCHTKLEKCRPKIVTKIEKKVQKVSEKIQ